MARKLSTPTRAAGSTARRRRGAAACVYSCQLAFSVVESTMAEKILWRGRLISVQPRIRLTRSFDQSSHTYLGYALGVAGAVSGEDREFLIGVGKGAHEKRRFQVGQEVSGECLPVADPRLENVEFYKVSKLKVHDPSGDMNTEPPPWLGIRTTACADGSVPRTTTTRAGGVRTSLL